MCKNKCLWIIFSFLCFTCFTPNVQALTGIVNVNDSLSLRNQPTTSGALITRFYNATSLTILDTNAGSGNGCVGNWYRVSYNQYTGYSCGDYITLQAENHPSEMGGEDDSYSKGNYDKAPGKDGTIMCYEDTGALSLRSSANGSRTGEKVNCGDEVDIIETVDKPNTTCPYWYKINTGSNIGYVCGYFVNTTKLSSTADNYYRNRINGDTIESYQNKLRGFGFPESYFPYLLELHARHPNWNFVAEKINLNFSDAVVGESGNGASLLQGSAFDKGYLSTAVHSYNLFTDTFSQYESEPGYYNASKEAIAYYMDPRNYLNEKYIFAFETLGYSSNQNASVVASILSGQSFWPSIYQYYNRADAIHDTKGNVNEDVVDATSKVGISAVHVASRIKQEITGLSTSDSRIGGTFTYNGNSFSNYYNFFNIKSRCKNCDSIYSGYAYEQGWNTPYKGIYGGASFLYDGYISLNQDTIYYEKFDVSTTNGHYTHQYMQNLAAPVQEGGMKHKGYVNGLSSYLNTDITFVIPVYNEMPKFAVTAPKLGSPNNYLKGLTVDGGSVANFNYDTYNYNVYLDKNKTSVMVGATTMVDSALVNGIGNITIHSDNQTNQIVVTAQNGRTKVYTINFIRETMESTTIGEAMNHSGFKYNNNYLFGVDVGVNVAQLIGNIREFNHSVSVTVKASDGTVKTNDIFKTGDTVTIAGSDGTKTYTVIIYGDVNGDGRITAVDYVNVKNYIMQASNLSNSYLAAADVNKDGKVMAVDYVQIKNHIMGKNMIVQ